jgi:uncharacterized protein YjbI with pentapeptide repeats
VGKIKEPHPLTIGEEFFGEVIENKRISSNDLKAQKVQGVKFYNCCFEGCDLTGCLFWMVNFQNCDFINCTVERVVFRKCELNECGFERCSSRFYFNISESYLYDSSFNDCRLEGVEVSGTDTSDILFENCTLSMGRFQATFTYRSNLIYTPEQYLDEEARALIESKEVYDDLVFNKCRIEFMDFRMLNLIDIKFLECQISKCSFNECILYEYNIDDSNNQEGWGTNSIDLSTLKQSQLIGQKTLNAVFNIGSDNQSSIQEMLKERVMSSVFISYSLKDSTIAHRINDLLKKSEVTTFLWERDAPGGITLKSIMKSSIEAKDRLLFIASENSLKSEACHFELSEGRKKQDKLWKTILFPVHLDDFLLSIDYESIRPRHKREEYWQNILELRDINSLDFTAFKSGTNGREEDFEKAMKMLVESLKIR